VDVYQLEVFLAVFRNRSFSRAAEQLHLSQPAVSAHIKKLEEELGTDLFDRIGRKTVPTREGNALFHRAERIIEQVRDLPAEIRQESREISGLLTVAAASVPGSYVVPGLAAEFRKGYPRVFFEVKILTSKEITGRVLDGEILLGVVDTKPREGDLHVVHTIRDELVLAARPGLLEKKEISPLQLFKIPLLMREEGSDARESMERQHLLHRVSLKALNVTAILGSTDSVKEAVKAGLGAAILSRYVIRDELAAGLVEAVRIKGVTMRRTFSVIAHRKRTLPAPYAAFIEFLADCGKRGEEDVKRKK